MAVDTFFWPIKPNWKTPLVETFKWYTTVFRSRSGYEQRRGLRDGNRRGIEYDFLAKEENAQLLDNLLLKAKAQAFWVPDWQYRCVTTADVAIGDTVIPGDVTYCPFKAADIDGNDALGVVIYRDRDTYELAQVSAVADDQLTLTAPTTKAWPAGTTFYPYGKARILGNVPLKRLSDQVSQGRVTFENYPGERGSYIPWGFYASYIPAYETDRPTTTLGGGELLLTRPDWINGIDTDVEFVGETVDEDIGPVEQFVIEEFATVTRPMRWLLKSRRQIHLFKEFLGRRWGRRQSFYMPSWTSDLIVTNAIAATDTTMICKNTGAGLLLWFAAVAPPYPSDVSRYWVMIRTHTHGDIFRRVSLASSDALSIVVDILDENWEPTTLGVALLPSDIKVIHFISAYRFASDEVSLTWHTDGVAVAEIPVMTVAEFPELIPIAATVAIVAGYSPSFGGSYGYWHIITGEAMGSITPGAVVNGWTIYDVSDYEAFFEIALPSDAPDDAFSSVRFVDAFGVERVYDTSQQALGFPTVYGSVKYFGWEKSVEYGFIEGVTYQIHFS